MMLVDGARGRFRRAFLSGVFAASFALGFGVTAAWANVAQDGRISTNNSVDGASVNVEGESFYPPSNSCVLYGLLVTADVGRHVETGLVRCDNVSIDGTCPSGKKFLERWNGTGFFCVPGGDFDNDVLYQTYIQRNGDTSTTMTGYMGSASISQSGFALNDDTYTLAWGEVTSGSSTTCPTGDAHGVFTLWNKYSTNSGWSTVTNATIYHGGTVAGAPCWTVGVQGSSGGFHVWP